MRYRPSIFPVIHYLSGNQAMENAHIAFDAECEGVFLIDMEADDHHLLDSAASIKQAFPDKLVGVNLLSVHEPCNAVLYSVQAGLDMTWMDHQLTHSDDAPWTEAKEVGELYPGHLKFVGVSFKYQKREHDPVKASRAALELGFIPTTSGPGTGKPCDLTKLFSMRRGIGPEAPLAIASGVTPDNVLGHCRYLTHILVSTGVSKSMHELCLDKLTLLRETVNNQL